jgi:hypothetical protein
MPTARCFHCAAVVGGSIFIAGVQGPGGALTDAPKQFSLEALTTAGWTGAPSSSPTFAPTYGSCGTECWATRNSLPMASTNGAQACAAVGSLVYMYQHDQPSPSGQGFHKYDTATDTWAAGCRPVPVRTTAASRHTPHARIRTAAHVRMPTRRSNALWQHALRWTPPLRLGRVAQSMLCAQ